MVFARRKRIFEQFIASATQPVRVYTRVWARPNTLENRAFSTWPESPHIHEIGGFMSSWADKVPVQVRPSFKHV